MRRITVGSWHLSRAHAISVPIRTPKRLKEMTTMSQSPMTGFNLSSAMTGMARTAAVLAAASMLSTVPHASAADESPPANLEESAFPGEFNLDLRLRFENVHQESVGPAGRRGQGHAQTARLRLGYRTPSFEGFSGYAELEGGQSIDDETYNGVIEGDPSEGVIADPDFAEFNQAYAQFERWGLRLRGGRQRIVLDDVRFIGDVGWRNDQQTYDAVSARYAGLEDWTFFYAYLAQINRIFGDELDRDSDSHLINVSYDALPIGKLTGFAYLLDFRGDADLADGNTFGFRLQDTLPLNEELELGYVGSYARIVNAGPGEAFEANYYILDLSLNHKPWDATLGAAYEVLGSDDGGYGFQTPLATLHKWSGWADMFLSTPATGLRDFYVYGKKRLPWDINGTIVGHAFWAEDGHAWYGWELDAVLSKAITEHVTVLGKVAWFEGETSAAPAAPPNDTVRFWLQADIRF